MLMLLYSPEGIQAFTEMATDEFAIQWSELTPDEAHYLLFLVNLADQVKSIAHHAEVFSLMPPIVNKALTTVLAKLSIYRPVLEGIALGNYSPFEANQGHYE